jgi:hypothetical protein
MALFGPMVPLPTPATKLAVGSRLFKVTVQRFVGNMQAGSLRMELLQFEIIKNVVYF